jgi:Domain of unknown function (DUF4349)
MNGRRFLIALGLLAAVLAACGGPAAQAPVTEVMVAAMATGAPAATQAPAPELIEAPVAAEAVATAAPGEVEAPSAAGQLAFAPAGSRLVIKDGEVELLVNDTDRAIQQVTQLAADYNGYIISSQVWFADGFKYASLRLGIPSANFETALNLLRGMGLKVLRESASGQDVSAEYVDLQSRLTNLEATAARVREFLAAAKTVDESLRISRQLAELEGQIEQVKGQLRYYEGRAAFSTLTVYLTPDFPTPTPTATPTNTPTPTPTPAWNPGETFDDASGTLVGMTHSTVNSLIWLGVVGGPPALIVLALVSLLRIAANRRRQTQGGDQPDAE